ncbi:MAG: alanine racemase [bacterium]|nr:alanine racemase [bacterium]
MKSISLVELAGIIGGELHGRLAAEDIRTITIDSRRIGNGAVFFSLQGSRTDGHRFIEDAFCNGAVAAVASSDNRDVLAGLQEKPIIFVDDPLAALQRLAAWWRTRLSGHLIAVTGSNGKTIVKDALIQALQYSYLVSGSQGSHNSQLGVPLSVLRLPDTVDMAVIEAGVSQPGEMSSLEAILKPDYGILTNIGMAHIAGFGTCETIAREKLNLFKNIGPDGWVLIPHNWTATGGCPYDIDELPAELNCRVYRYGRENEELPFIYKQHNAVDGIVLDVRFPSGAVHNVLIRTFSAEIASDIEAAICAACLLGADENDVVRALQAHEPAHTRMEIWRSPAGITLINDSCSADPISVQSALRSQAHLIRQGDRSVFVFGGMQNLGQLEQREHYHIGEMAARHGVELLVLVGGTELDEELDVTEEAFRAAYPAGRVLRYQGTDNLASNLRPHLRSGDKVLFKGPSGTGIDRVARETVDAMAYNRLIVDIVALSENISRFRRLVGPDCKILGMVKALAYGSDLVSLSRELQELGLDLLGVSTADEGMTLRTAGVDLPILVMLCTQDEVYKAVRHHLTPVIYSAELAASLAEAAENSGQTVDVHLKVDTGMGRLGVKPDEIVDFARLVMSHRSLRITGLATHFACADDPAQDEFTRMQILRFGEVIDQLRALDLTDLTCHAAATAGAVRFPEGRFDMVRIGLGLYGLYPGPAVEESLQLDLAVTLLSRIAVIQRYRRGDRIGYGGTFVVPYDGFTTGVIPMGYHDGLPVHLSNRGYVLVNGRKADIIGRISMDSAMIDINGIEDARIGSDVLIYGKHNGHILRPEIAAGLSGTIVYELLARLGPRVQRIFVGK